MFRYVRSVLPTMLLAGLILAGPTQLAFANKETQPMSDQSRLALATFAGGCFWCMEPPFDQLDGVAATISGYMGGETANPTYDEVSAGRTGHAEVVQVRYDPARVSYQQLLAVFWRNINPTDADGQFVDRGSQYRSAIFYHDDRQKQWAEESRTALAASGRFSAPIVTAIVPAGPFYPAEAYHQDYYRNSPLRYKFYRYNSGRDQFLKKIWEETGD
ncbi:MAG: peptide-methionine (S)-S-oxide reductase MsrA [Desulfuromonadales bacterium]|nr:peptide-methionine (S)-S-oxide reductase MsrA [Desulfuromonadales bacterium]